MTEGRDSTVQSRQAMVRCSKLRQRQKSARRMKGLKDCTPFQIYALWPSTSTGDRRAEMGGERADRECSDETEQNRT